MAAITSIETTTLAVPARGVPLTQMLYWSAHTARAIRSEGPDMIDHLEREEAMQTRLFSQLWYAKHTKNPLQKKGANFSVFSNTNGEDIEELCSALMHWLWSYAMCLPGQWRETLMHTNNIELCAHWPPWRPSIIYFWHVERLFCTILSVWIATFSLPKPSFSCWWSFAWGSICNFQGQLLS